MSKIKDVFKDYKEENNLINAEIDNVNLFKKSKKLEIFLKIKEEIKIGEISSFEDYLKERFKIEKVSIIVENREKGAIPLFPQKIKEDWKDILEYLSKHFPLCKAILGTSSIELEDNKIIVSLKTKGSDFLHSYEIDKEIERLILNIYGEKHKVEFREDVNENIIKEQEKYLENLEKTVCEDLMQEIRVKDEIAKEIEQKEKEFKEEISEGTEKTPLILGRSDKIKDQIMKISDLSTDYGRVALEGKVISVDSRELKNGKTLAMFNLYDGTSTITCKSFINEDIKDEVMRKTKKSKKT